MLMQQALSLAQTDEEKSEALIRLGQVAQDQENFAQARQFWQQYLQVPGVSNEELAVIQLAVALTYANEDDVPMALQEIKKYEEMKGATDEGRAMVPIVMTAPYVRAGQWRAVIALLEPVTSDLNKSASARMEAQTVIGYAYSSQGKTDEALVAYRAITANKEALPRQKAQAQNNINTIEAGRGRAEVAEAETRTLITAFLEKTRAILAIDRKDMKTARPYFDAILVMAPTGSAVEIWAHEQFGEAYFRAKDYEPAREQFKQALAIAEPAGLSAKDVATVAQARRAAHSFLGDIYIWMGNLGVPSTNIKRLWPPPAYPLGSALTSKNR